MAQMPHTQDSSIPMATHHTFFDTVLFNSVLQLNFVCVCVNSANTYAKTLGALSSRNIGAYLNTVAANNYQAAVRYSPPNRLSA